MAEKNDQNSPSDEENYENIPRSFRPDVCNEGSSNNAVDRDHADQPPNRVDEVTRREENPFSFKRFLNQDNRGGGGARRKECAADGTPVLHTPEMSSVLPDFVQDHLVIEQCYLSPSHNDPLPFDLPRPAEERVDLGVAMSLPDFLSDGPIHSQRCNGETSYQASNEPSSSNTPQYSTWSNEDLQREIGSLSRRLHDRNREVLALENRIETLHRESRDANFSEHALLQVENNLRQTTRRMVAAETEVSRLKSENNLLKARLETLGEASGGASSSTSGAYQPNRRLAQDLRGAASAAEVHLRALTIGIANLRQLACSVDDTQENDDEQGAAGPAL